jgi:uncharacterized membrane protein
MSKSIIIFAKIIFAIVLIAVSVTLIPLFLELPESVKSYALLVAIILMSLNGFQILFKTIIR